jgi:hypothetical protein
MVLSPMLIRSNTEPVKSVQMTIERSALVSSRHVNGLSVARNAVPSTFLTHKSSLFIQKLDKKVLNWTLR